MTRLTQIADLYAASGSIGQATSVVELFAIADPAGALLDRAVRELGLEVKDGAVDLLGELLAAARRLRWRIAIEPYPATPGTGRAELVAEITNLAGRCRLMVGSETRWVVDELLRSAKEVNGAATSPLGEFLVQSLREARSGDSDFAIIAAGARAAAGIRSWLRELDIAVPVLNDREKADAEMHSKAYFIGAPPVFSPAALGAPRAHGLAFLFPSWVQDRALPTTDFSAYAEGGIRPRTRMHRIGAEAYVPDRLRQVERQLRPEPVWDHSRRRIQVGEDEVRARRVFLCGGLSIMLGLDGESIRTLDPARPVGARIQMRDVETVSPGIYLVLREGQTESGPLYARALVLLADQAGSVEQSQSEWKSALRQRLQVEGPAEVKRNLHRLGVNAAAQAPAWTAQTLARPRSDVDFAILLRWLGLPLEPYRQHSNVLRRARYQAQADVREALEAALGDADMLELERTGFLKLDLELEGFAGIVATRVIALSPHLEVVPRSELRIPKEDSAAQWLE